MPAQTDRVQTLREEAGEGEIPYISKSRIKKFVTCPRKFYYSYIRGVPTPETDAMRRGTDIHETFEGYYENVQSYVEEHGEVPDDLVTMLPDDSSRWGKYMDPYISNFLVWEKKRLNQAKIHVARENQGYNPEECDRRVAELWLPVAVEAEEWLEDPLDYGEDAIPWMGYADVIVDAATVPACEEDEGVVIVDFKTSSKTPKEQYRDEGIYLEGEYYAMLFESEYDVAGVAGFYPAPGEMVVSPLKEERRDLIREVVTHIHEHRELSDYEADEQPLCQYGVGPEKGCAFYGICSSTWGEPAKNEDAYEKFKEVLSSADGDKPYAVAQAFNMDYGAAKYWVGKEQRGQLP